MSIRYKFILSLLLLTATCLGTYIWIAKDVFEKDKEAAIFESASQTSKIQAFTFKQHLDNSIGLVNSLLPTWDPETQNFTGAGEALFQRTQDLLALGIIENGQFLSFKSKNPALTAETLAAKFTAQPATVQDLEAHPGTLLLSIPSKNTENQTSRSLILVLSIQNQLNMLPFSEETGGSFLALANKPISNSTNFPFGAATDFLAALPSVKNMGEQTLMTEIHGKDFLISSNDVQFGELRIFTVIPKEIAFMGLGLLYRKSLQFFGLIFFIVLIVAVVMTQTLLRNLDSLSLATEQVSKGDFDIKLQVNSSDEFGKLAASFQHMSKEIKRLIVETLEKARMQSELKTAKLVQENLFPISNYKDSRLEIQGLYRSASECGGDWWYYFEHKTGLYVFICDATGHGAPAALITAAAKATVNLMKKEKELDLLKLTEAFNYALYETARGTLLMTGFVLHIKEDRSIEYVNASHEPPFIFDGTDVDFLMDPIGPRFGQGLDSKYETGKLGSMDGKVILMYTDGITGQQNGAEKEFGDKRLTRFLQKNLAEKTPLAELNKNVFAVVDDFRQEVSQADDLTIVSIRFS